MDLIKPAIDAAFEVAVEHIAWCIRRGDAVEDVYRNLGARMSPGATWNDAIWLVAGAYDLAGEIRFRARMRAA